MYIIFYSYRCIKKRLKCPGELVKTEDAFELIKEHVCDRKTHQTPGRIKMRELCQKAALMPGAGSGREIHRNISIE